jgi:cytoskeletal protein CcmA (bactofilin family)
MFHLGSGSVMQGNLVSAGSIKLDGWFEGDIVCTRLEIGADGYLLGRVMARELRVAGQIVGNVTAGEVHLLDGAFIEGDVRHVRLAIEAGATLSGKSLRILGVHMPEHYLALEVRAEAERADLDHAERQSLRAAASKAVVDYRRYQEAKAKFVRGQPRLGPAP